MFKLGAGLIALSAAGAALAAGAELHGVHLSGAAHSAQLRLDVTGLATKRIFTLERPFRTVIDLSQTRVARGLRMPAGAGLVSDIRLGQQPGGTSRIVVQLSEHLIAHSIWLAASQPGHRELVIDFGDPPAQADTVAHIVRAAHAPVDSDRDVIIAVDAGHGGADPGAIGRSGTREKDVVLAIARLLARRIDEEPGMKAVLTRDRDEFLVLRDRIRRARVAKADMFVSVHADSIANRDISGASVYVLSERGASNEAARWLAERENAADLMGGVSLEDKDATLKSVLLDLSQSANISASMSAAQRVLSALDGVGAVRKSQVQQAGFVVLKSPDIPSMLVETAYISNPHEELRLRSVHQQVSLADAIFEGIRGYFERNPPAGSRFAAQLRGSTVASVIAAPSTR
ncbi:MAG TPA: N-acetylmuramoyl-L-alanine amidase [Steroidobacteraceae bacterium]|nr:N-acetylmuramoyl-L-alanine amidase [Steroidobacteraceae bacterium]